MGRELKKENPVSTLILWHQKHRVYKTSYNQDFGKSHDGQEKSSVCMSFKQGNKGDRLANQENSFLLLTMSAQAEKGAVAESPVLSKEL